MVTLQRRLISAKNYPNMHQTHVETSFDDALIRGFHGAPTRPQLACQLSPNCCSNFTKCDQSWCTSWGQRHECPIVALLFERQTYLNFATE